MGGSVRITRTLASTHLLFRSEINSYKRAATPANADEAGLLNNPGQAFDEGAFFSSRVFQT